MIKLLLVAGARPNFMKIAPIIREIKRRPEQFAFVLVHTGQHYDEGMSDVFFRDLGIPKPDHHLNVGSGSHAAQTARIMTSFEPVLLQEKPDWVLVVGDVNSTLACSIVAKKLGFPVAHVEAGLRSGDMNMPEEINRIVTDSISDKLFVTEQSGVENLLREGKPKAAVHFVGHVMIDNLFYEVQQLKAADTNTFHSAGYKASRNRYGVVTLHRPSNVDDTWTLKSIMSALSEISLILPLAFPVHPRTRKKIAEARLDVPSTITLMEPLGYRDFLHLWKDAAVVLTDSGGLQEETTALGVPCVTIRENTERPITVSSGTNVLAGCDAGKIVAVAKRQLAVERTAPGAIRQPALWDGAASARILDVFLAAS